MLSKIKTILLSRTKKNNNEDWVDDRRRICLDCEHNSLNTNSPQGYKFFLATLSYAYSYIMGRAKEDILGNCFACEACSIYFKSESDEDCPENKWEKRENGTIILNIREQRKNGSNKNNKK